MAKIEIYQPKDTEVGDSFVFYGPPAVGKTYALGSLCTLGKTLIINCEQRNVAAVLRDFRDSKNLYLHDLRSYDDARELLGTLAEEGLNGRIKYKFVCIDGSTTLQRRLLSELEDDHTNRLLEKEKDVSLVDRYDLGEWKGWKALSARMWRLHNDLNHLTIYGVHTFFTCGVIENPRWNRDIEHAPAFVGKDYPVNLPYLPDHIGYLSFNHDDDGNIMYPSLVSFACNDDTFLAKTNQERLRRTGPFNLPKIIKVLEKANKGTQE